MMSIDQHSIIPDLIRDPGTKTMADFVMPAWAGIPRGKAAPFLHEVLTSVRTTTR